MSLRTTLLAAAGLLALGAGTAHAVTFAFPASGSTPLSITSGGVTATFSSTAGAGVFTVGTATGLFPFTGLGDFNSFSGDPLTISFSSPVTQPITFQFGIEDLFGTGNDSLTLTANTGQTATVAARAASFPVPPLGNVSFTPSAAISSLTITSANPFAIGNVSVPEPVSLALLGTGLFGLAATRRRRS